mmetsp:Transcript_13843/g.38035  ORF Transcript_13843/g.38035 Transcript_13843/m.38035 type:complete len:221 (-) Transcript_13843:69-731(-)
MSRLGHDNDAAQRRFLHPKCFGQLHVEGEFRMLGEHLVIEELVGRRLRHAVRGCDAHEGAKVQCLASILPTIGIVHRPIHVQNQLLMQHLHNFQRHVDHAPVQQKPGGSFRFAGQYRLQLLLAVVGAVVEADGFERLYAIVLLVSGDIEDGRKSKDVAIDIAFCANDCTHADVFDHEIGQGRGRRAVQRTARGEQRLEAMKVFLIHVAKGEFDLNDFGAR